jgi:hypothetical protein
MKKIVTVLHLFVFTCCLAQTNQPLSEKFKPENYKDLTLHPGVIDNPESTSHIYIKGNKIIIYSEYDGKISIRESLTDSPYQSTKLYSQKTLFLLKEQQEFYDFCFGITKVYTEEGLLINTINCDQKYNFSVGELIKKIETEYGIDLNNRKTGRYGLSRVYIREKYCYQLFIGVTLNPKGATRIVVIDGNTGKTLSNTVAEYNPEGDPTW